MKKNWAKAAVLMSVRGAFLRISWSDLEIKFKTKFALNSVNNPDTISLLNWGLVSIWMSWINVKLV